MRSACNRRVPVVLVVCCLKAMRFGLSSSRGRGVAWPESWPTAPFGIVCGHPQQLVSSSLIDDVSEAGHRLYVALSCAYVFAGLPRWTSGKPEIVSYGKPFFSIDHGL